MSFFAHRILQEAQERFEDWIDDNYNDFTPEQLAEFRRQHIDNMEDLASDLASA
jgi:hypothetical protein